MSTRIVRTRQFTVVIAARARPDPIRLTLRNNNLNPEQAIALAFYLMKAGERVKLDKSAGKKRPKS